MEMKPGSNINVSLSLISLIASLLLPCGWAAAFSPPPHFLLPDQFTFMKEPSLVFNLF